MFSINVSVGDLLSRINADAYAPEFLASSRKLSAADLNLQTLGQAVCKPINNSIRGVTEHLDLPQAEIPMFRPADIRDGVADPETAPRIPSEFEAEHQKARVYPGDIVLGIAGSVAVAGRVPASVEFGNINGSSARISASTDERSAYILAYLISRLGQSELLRLGVGSVQKHLNLEDLPSVPVPILKDGAERYIGNKVRQAERLRAWAKACQVQAENLLGKELFWGSWATNPGILQRIAGAELGSRLDLKYNSPERIALMRHFKKHGVECERLSRLADISAMIGWKGLTTEYYRTTGPWLLRGVEFAGGLIDFDALVCVDEEKYAEQPQIHLREGDIALTKDGTIGKAVVIPKLSNRMAVASTVARIRIKASSDVEPYYLEYALNHRCVTIQVESFATGIAQPHITQEWIAELLIPRVSNERQIAIHWKEHHDSVALAKALTTAAKLLVEALIEGQLTEADLIAAQQALEAGDDGPDRAILARLTPDGLDGSGAPLFPDLDRLATLLARAASEAAGDAD
jgi:type I restriction enzyme, S subunit